MLDYNREEMNVLEILENAIYGVNQSLEKIIEKAILSTMTRSSYFSKTQIIKSCLKEIEEQKFFGSRNPNINNLFARALELKFEEFKSDEKDETVRLRSIELSENRKDTGKFTTAENLRLEKETIGFAKFSALDELRKNYDESIIKDNGYAVDKGVTIKNLNKMPLMSEEQRQAVRWVNNSDSMTSIYQGKAGAGKSFTSKGIKDSYHERDFVIKGLALSWNAAQVLSESAGIDDCQAIEGFCRSYEKAKESGSCVFNTNTLLIVDEAGLVGTRHMHTILEAAYTAFKNYGRIVKVVLTGDALQLLPVNAGGMFKTLERVIGSSTIEKIRRQRLPSQREMVALTSERMSGRALHIMQQQEMIKWCVDGETTKNKIIEDYLSFRYNNTSKTALILALNNEHVTQINAKVRAALKKMGMLKGNEVKLNITNGQKRWEDDFLEGDEIVIRHNYKEIQIYEVPEDENNFDYFSYKEKDIGVFNRNKGIIRKIQKSMDGRSYDLFVDIFGDGDVIKGRTIINTNNHLVEGVLPIHHNYATTIYASQGQTVDSTFLMFDEKMDFRLFYVGASRHRETCKLYINESLIHFLLDRDVKRKTGEIRRNYYDKDGNEAQVELGRYSRQNQLNFVSSICGKNKENQTALDYIYEQTKPLEKQLTNQERYEVMPHRFDDYIDVLKPLTDDVEVGDASFKLVKKEDVENEHTINLWWQNFYLRIKTNFVSDENKLQAFQRNAEEMNEDFQKFKKDILALNGLPEDYVIEERDRIEYKPRIFSPNEKEIDLQAILKETGDYYQDSHIVPEEEVNIRQHRESFHSDYQFAKNKNNQQQYDDNLSGNRVESDVDNNEEDLTLLEFQEMLKGFNSLPMYKNLVKNNPAYGNQAKEEVKEESEVKKAISTSVGNSKLFSSILQKEVVEVKEEVYNEEKDIVEEKVTLREILFKPQEERTVKINIKGDLEIIKTKGFLGGNEVLDFVNQQGRNVIWHMGIDYEPRFLAIDHKTGLIKEKYDEFGNAKIGTGYPALLLNELPNDKTAVTITNDFQEWIYLYYFNVKRFCKDKENLEECGKAPHVLWGTKDTDYALVAKHFHNKEFRIAKGNTSKNDEWAYELRNYLWDVHRIRAKVQPDFPEGDPRYAKPWDNIENNNEDLLEMNLQQSSEIEYSQKVSKGLAR